MKKLLFSLIAVALVSVCLAADLNIAGTWDMTMDSPHGKLTGPLKLEQDGTKLNGTYETEMAGKLSITGNIDGEKVLFSMSAPNGMTIRFEGAMDGDKLSGTTKPMNGEWSAVRK